MFMRRRRMAASMAVDPSFSLQVSKDHDLHKSSSATVILDEIEGLIKVYGDGHVERPPIVPCVTCSLAPGLGVMCRDIVIDRVTSVWARFYVPDCNDCKLPLLVYFHGGGFCVGSAAWSCYHEFLALSAVRARCIIMSVNYRLAPENPLPAAYDDGLKALMWAKQRALDGRRRASDQWWSGKCNFASIFLGGDSAGANIAYNVAIRLSSNMPSFKPLGFKGNILIQPFFGGQTRTNSETYSVQPPRSALSLAASDTYWRLSLPLGANRDHPWCNPGAKGSAIQKGDFKILPTMVCVSEMDILKDRNLEFCEALAGAGKEVERFVYKGVGHAFQVLNNSPLSLTKTHEMMCHIKTFINATR